MLTCSTMMMGLEAVGLLLAGKKTETTVNIEYGAKRKSSSPSTFGFSTRLTCLQRYLHAYNHRPQPCARAELSPGQSLATRVHLYYPVNGRLASVKSLVPEPAATHSDTHALQCSRQAGAAAAAALTCAPRLLRTRWLRTWARGTSCPQ